MADLVLDQADEKMEDPLNAFCWAPNTKSIVLFSLAQFIENGFRKRIARNWCISSRSVTYRLSNRLLLGLRWTIWKSKRISERRNENASLYLSRRMFSGLRSL